MAKDFEIHQGLKHMKVMIFTIRNNVNNELIFAENTNVQGEYFSSFKLDKKWLEEIEIKGAWYESADHYAFDEKVTYLVDRRMKYINFNLEDIEIN